MSSPAVHRRTALSAVPAAKDFVSDAHAHCKFVGYGGAALALFEAAGLRDKVDDGYVELDGTRATADAFIETCGQLRHWVREPMVNPL